MSMRPSYFCLYLPLLHLQILKTIIYDCVGVKMNITQSGFIINLLLFIIVTSLFLSDFKRN